MSSHKTERVGVPGIGIGVRTKGRSETGVGEPVDYAVQVVAFESCSGFDGAAGVGVGSKEVVLIG